MPLLRSPDTNVVHASVRFVRFYSLPAIVCDCIVGLSVRFVFRNIQIYVYVFEKEKRKAETDAEAECQAINRAAYFATLLVKKMARQTVPPAVLHNAAKLFSPARAMIDC